MMWGSKTEGELAEARATIRVLESEIERLERTLEREQEERHRLLDVVVEMKREGFSPPQPVPERGPREEVDPRLLRAVEAKARPGEPLFAELMTHATMMQKGGSDLEEVIRDIERGGAYPDEEF